MRGHHHHEHHDHESHHHFFGRRGFGGHGFSPFWGRDGGGRGRHRTFDSTELRLVLLKLVGDQPRHGYELIRVIEELTGGAYSPSPGMVYPTLALLSEMGHIREDDSGKDRKTFAITEDGSAFLAENKSAVEALFARLAELGAQKDPADSAPVRRAMGNLVAVLMHRARGADTQTVHAITAILDEAAQRIERL